jgi:hypothetical protein
VIDEIRKVRNSTDLTADLRVLKTILPAEQGDAKLRHSVGNINAWWF